MLQPLRVRHDFGQPFRGRPVHGDAGSRGEGSEHEAKLLHERGKRQRSRFFRRRSAREFGPFDQVGKHFQHLGTENVAALQEGRAFFLIPRTVRQQPQVTELAEELAPQGLTSEGDEGQASSLHIPQGAMGLG